MQIKFQILACLLAAGAFAAQPALTLYNQNFAVVRDTVTLDLKAGVNEVRFADATAHVEPDSVILRDPGGEHPLQILEQNYRNDPVSQELLLSLFEGKTIDFEVPPAGGEARAREIIRGKIIRSGYVPHYSAMNRYGSSYYQAQMAAASATAQPIIQVNGKLRFSLPGQPLFPSLGDDTILKPTLKWVIQSPRPGKFDAEVSYVTGGFTWEADYNLVAPEQGDAVDLIGWVTMDNQSGKDFREAKIKLMAGDVNKIQPIYALGGIGGGGGPSSGARPAVTEKSFDEYHLYTLARATTLLDREKKQVEFVHATGVKTATIYVYDGARLDDRIFVEPNTDRNYGVGGNQKVQVVREFRNAETNHLGLPLPQGRLRFYRRDDDGQLEFTGEETIEHTPKDETIRVTTGNAFDLVGERTQMDFKIYLFNHPAVVDPSTGMVLPNSNPSIDPLTGQWVPGSSTNSVPPGPWIDESFEIKLRNHKSTSVEIRVVEHLYRWSNWQITKKTDAFAKTDVQTVEFKIPLKPDEERTLSYTVHYSW